MINFLEQVKKKINEKLNPEHVLLIDKSHLHVKHDSFNTDKFYLKLIIKSKKLKNIGKIEAHKIIFSILKEEMNDKIHALEIEIQ